MTGLIGYNFCSDINALDPTPTCVKDTTTTRIQNGIFDNFNVSKDTSFDYDNIIPVGWTENTLMNADFSGNASAGNVDEIATDVTGVRIKRRIKGTFDWMTIREISVSKPEDMSFVIMDNLNVNNVEYEYAFVPMRQEVEGNYIIESIVSKFNGVFICDINTVIKFKAGVEYSNNDAVQQIGVLQPYNRQYPIIVSNSIINYQTGSIGGWVLPENFEENYNIDRAEIVKERKIITDYLQNKKPKIIKDYNGNAWLVFFTGNPNFTYDNNYGQGMVKVNAQWTEIGNVNSKMDLFESGMIPTKE